MTVLILIGLFVVLLLVLPTAINRHAVLKVISIFREHSALCSDSAKTIDELGLRQSGFGKRLVSFRDYKPQALRGLIQADIVQVTAEDKLFLAEDKIANPRPLKH
ncbi:MAG: hypothetical protein P1P89_21815 [Desulfobacterales bacterium]|nr:hypothetical protein [Desulfobacterales bacterium]